MRDQAHASGRSAAGVGLARGEAAIFSPGDRIRTMTRSPVGHCYVPTYLRGKAGVVDVVIEPAGAEMAGKLTYYERWIAAFANILFQKGILTPGELARKMDEVEARYVADASAMTQ